MLHSSRQIRQFLESKINITKCIDGKGRFGKLLASKQMRKVWEVERDHDVKTWNKLEKENKLINNENHLGAKGRS